MITYKDWEKLVLELGGQTWESNQELPTKSIVFSTAEHVDNLFRDILETDYRNEFVLVSAASDAGPTYQSDCSVVRDTLNAISMDATLSEKLGQHDYIVRSRHEKSRCLARDKFCFKMYIWKSSTFPCIPKQIKRWYTTNCQISEPRVIPIPFGINPDSVELLKKYRGRELNLSNKPICCWSDHTNFRHNLKKALDKNEFYTEFTDLEKFYNNLSLSKFCLCPEGNGLDSYRILEAIYLGCLPIIITELTNPIWTQAYEGIPVIRASEITSYLSTLISSNLTLDDFKVEGTDLDYWRNHVSQI